MLLIVKTFLTPLYTPNIHIYQKLLLDVVARSIVEMEQRVVGLESELRNMSIRGLLLQYAVAMQIQLRWLV